MKVLAVLIAVALLSGCATKNKPASDEKFNIDREACREAGMSAVIENSVFGYWIVTGCHG